MEKKIVSQQAPAFLKQEGVISKIHARHILDSRGNPTVEVDITTKDGTENKSALGANAILGVSMAVARTASQVKDMLLFQYIGKMIDNKEFRLPVPLINVCNGAWVTDVQEYFIIPVGAKTYSEAIRWSAETFHNLKSVLKGEKYTFGVGDEGVYNPAFRNGNVEPMNHIKTAIGKVGYSLGSQFGLGFDSAFSEVYDTSTGEYVFRSEGGRKQVKRKTILLLI